jgi:putative aldouronate transport system substrate-binding protein
MLQAFKTTDCNGNGKADEIPLTGFVSGAGVPMVAPYLMCAFIYDDAGDRLRLDAKTGKIDVSYDKPEWRDGLTYLRKLYADKLMDPGALTTTSADLRKVGENAEAQLIGACPGIYPGDFTSMAGERQKDYDVILPLKGPNGVQLTAWNPTATVSTGEFAITKACKCPEVAMRWIDWFFTTEGGLRSRIGIEGKQWRWAKPEEKSVTGGKATWIQVAPINEPQNMFWGQSAIPQHFIWAEQASCEPILSGANCALNWRIALSTQEYEKYVPEAVVPPLWVAKADVALYSQLRTEINNYVNQSLARFIAGELKIEGGDWDTYLKQLKQIGLDEYVSLVQKAYDAKYMKS